MKKIIVINCSPRKMSNTAQLLQEATKGAKDSGAEVEYYNLVDLNFKGCISCFACKRKGATTNGLCAVKDELTPILEKILNADAVIIGSPMYFSDTTGMFRNLIERMLFPAFTYLKDETTGFGKRVLNKIIPVGFIYTMNVTKEGAEFYDYNKLWQSTNHFIGFAFGHAEMLCSYDTYQFSDYSKYECDIFDEEIKRQVRETQFPKDLQSAYEMGKRFASEEM